MIKAIIFDLNGIFLKSPLLSTRLNKDFGIPVGRFLPDLNAVMEIIRQPNVDNSFDYWGPVLKKWKLKFNEQEFWDYWFHTEKPCIEMLDAARLLKSKGIKTFILSNNFKERCAFYKNFSWLNEVFDKVYFSWQTGYVKPDPRAWELILKENDLKPNECLYFDDQLKNIKTAKSLGIPSFQFKTEHETCKIIKLYLRS